MSVTANLEQRKMAFEKEKIASKHLGYAGLRNYECNQYTKPCKKK